MRPSTATLLVASLVLAGCSGDRSTGPNNGTASEDDYALVMFGPMGAALETTLGPQASDRPFDGRSGWARLPEELALTDEQRAEIQALREAFRTEHADELEDLRAIFQEARAAREAGATREEIRAILVQGREIAMGLHLAVFELHQAIKGVFTAEQLAWLEAHRPWPPRDLDGRRRR